MWRVTLNSLAAIAMTLCFVISGSRARADDVPLRQNDWTVIAKEIRFEDYKGKKALFLRDGSAILKNNNFKNGIIEFDIAIPQTRAFLGLLFRLQDVNNAEELYLRAHQSGNPDANQYTPIFNGIAGWQLYYGPGYSAPVKYRFDEWMHVKLLILNNEAEVYIDSETPSFFIPELKREAKSGALGFRSLIGGAHYANLRVTETNNVRFATLPEKRDEQRVVIAEQSQVVHWAVSTPFAEELLRDQMSFPAELGKKLKFMPLDAEESGIANLARLQGIARGNTVVAALSLKADGEIRIPLGFGFSDQARVYLNGILLYKGDDKFQSRDYRFLGTLGLYDWVILPLQKGDNQLWIAVSEYMPGGWGVAASLPLKKGVLVSAGP